MTFVRKNGPPICPNCKEDFQETVECPSCREVFIVDENVGQRMLWNKEKEVWVCGYCNYSEMDESK